jgi:hypothetical protein
MAVTVLAHSMKAQQAHPVTRQGQLRVVVQPRCQPIHIHRTQSTHGGLRACEPSTFAIDEAGSEPALNNCHGYRDLARVQCSAWQGWHPALHSLAHDQAAGAADYTLSPASPSVKHVHI